MKNISVLKAVRIILVIVFVIQLISLCFENRFGESDIVLFRLISTVLLAFLLVVVFVFGNKIEQEKIEREQRKQRE